MFQINGMQIDVSGNQLLQDLRTSLNQNGIQLLNTIKNENGGNIQFSCPSHKGGQERTPSCGMSTIDTYKDGRKYPAGTIHCFTCGYTANLSEFISFCFGYKDGGIVGNNWLKANYRSSLVEKVRHFELNINRDKNTANNLPPVISEDILDKLAYTHPYMYKRGLTDDIINRFDIGFNKDTNSITFPIKDIEGQVRWIQSRSVTGKYYHIPAGIVKTEYLYGAYEVVQSGFTYAVIVESILNALTLWKYNIPAIALLGTGGGSQYNLLKNLPIRHYILALDNDKAGYEGTERLILHLRRYKLLSKLIYPDNTGKDINDYDQEVLNFKKVNINF